jgi:II/X family phage/plasmid replication protein
VIDWLTLRCSIDVPINAGHVASFTAEGEVEWHTPKRLELKGSHASTVTARRFPYDNSLEISGNPAKFLQGHNLFGSDDLPGLSRTFIRAVVARLGHTLTADEANAIDAGLVIITRIDTTQSWDFGTLPRALNAVRALSQHTHLSHRGKGSLIAEGTCIWGKGSRRWNGKAYAKGHELKAHKLHPMIPHLDKLTEYAQGLVRFEFTVRSMELKRRGLDVLQNWGTTGVTPETLHADLMSQLNISEATMIDADQLEQLPPRLQGVYQLWKDGHDVRAIYPTRTFYRHRAALLAFGIDLALVQPRRQDNVIPLRVTLIGKPATVPHWAVGTELLAA